MLRKGYCGQGHESIQTIRTVCQFFVGRHSLVFFGITDDLVYFA